jgi:hypothetical protein
MIDCEYLLVMNIIAEPERSKMYKRIYNLLGAPLRSVELTDEMMDSLMELSIGDYTQYVQDWLIESQWTSLYGLNLDTQSVANALVRRSLDWETQYTYAYSKIVGLQNSGPWVLKKDYFQLQQNQQIYEIPAGRELNELLWFSPSEQNSAFFDPWSFGSLGGPGIGGPGGFAQPGWGSGGYFFFSSYDVLSRLQDINLKRRIIQPDVQYRVTALPGGKKAVMLYNTPGGKFDFGNSELMRGKVWYWYYDTNDADRDQCLKDNPDIVKLPSDIPLDALSWQDLNDPAQQWVRRWLTAYAKETLARVRGKFSGNLKTPDSELQMDYTSLSTEAKDEKTVLLEELTKRLERLRPEFIMEREAKIATDLNTQLKFRAFPIPITTV